MFIGVDIVFINKIENCILNYKDKFTSRIFTRNEQVICNKKYNPSMHYSGKFAAKEAIKKALLSTKKIKSISLKSIEVVNDLDGAPLIKIYNKRIEYGNIQVSISHSGDYAIAMAVIA